MSEAVCASLRAAVAANAGMDLLQVKEGEAVVSVQYLCTKWSKYAYLGRWKKCVEGIRQRRFSVWCAFNFISQFLNFSLPLHRLVSRNYVHGYATGIAVDLKGPMHG
jgi:hypothetical protein